MEHKQLAVAFISRATLFTSPGGDTIQMLKTAEGLRKKGVHVDIYTTDQPIDYSKYTLLHFFNIIRPSDILAHTNKAKLPFFISPIFLDYEEYEQKNTQGLRKLAANNLKAHALEYIKCLGRHFLNKEKIRSFDFLLHGQQKSIQKLLKQCNAILPNSTSEYLRIEEKFGTQDNSAIIPCGVDLATFGHELNLETKKEPIVLCVGRIEGRKNQLSLIKAVQGTDYQLVIIGNHSPNHKKYFEACKRAAQSNVIFIQNVEQMVLVDYYKRAKVHALPSWFETVGLSNLEAAVLGCNLVLGDRGDVRDYFGNGAWYCEPGDVASIQTAIKNAMECPLNTELRQKVIDEYNWDIASQKTLTSYYKYL